MDDRLLLAYQVPVTVTVQLAVSPLQVAVITEVPAATPVTTPLVSTVAFAVVPEVQVIAPAPGPTMAKS